MLTSGPRGERGQGYVSALVLVAVVSGVTAHIVSEVNTLRTEIDRSAIKESQLQFATDLGAAVQMAEICKIIVDVSSTPFGSANELPARIRWTRGPTSTTPTVLAAGATVADRYLAIQNLNVVNVVRTGAIDATRDLYKGDLRLKVSSIRTGFEFKPLLVTPLYFEVVGGRALSCYGPQNYLALAPDLCRTAGGTIVNGRCTMKPIFPDVHCAEGEYLQAFQRDGSKTCKVLPPVALPTPSPPLPAPPATGTWGFTCMNCGSDPACTLANPMDQPCSPLGSFCAMNLGFGVRVQYACR